VIIRTTPVSVSRTRESCGSGCIIRAMHQHILATGQVVENVVGDWRDDITVWLRNDAPRLIAVLVSALVLIWLLRLLTRKLDNFSKSQPLPSGLRAQQLRTLASIIESVGSALVFFFAVLQIMPMFGVDVKPILASAGIAGLAVGFGAQTLVRDVINGFFILLENQYDLGDVVKIANVTGTVEVMTLRKTVVRDANGTVHTVPNSEIRVVSNLTRDWAQVSMHIAVDYNENSDRITKMLQEVGAELYNDSRFTEMLVAQPEVPGIERVSGRDVEYLMLVKVKPGQQWAVSRELRRRVKDCFLKNNVQTPGPARIYVAEPGEALPTTEVKQ
jgi:moderate conductance mechanosensitive channel